MANLVLIRFTRNYHERLKEYVNWLNYLKQNDIKVLNDVYIVKSNFFKYLQIKWLKENNNLLIDCEIFSIYDILNKKTG